MQYPKNSRRGFTKAEAVFVIVGVIIFVSVALVQWTERKQEVMEERSRVGAKSHNASSGNVARIFVFSSSLALSRPSISHLIVTMWFVSK